MLGRRRRWSGWGQRGKEVGGVEEKGARTDAKAAALGEKQRGATLALRNELANVPFAVRTPRRAQGG